MNKHGQRRQSQKKISEVAVRYDKAAVLQRVVGQRLLERGQWLNCQPTTVLDLGCNTGYFTGKLTKQFSSVRKVVGIDLTEGIVRYAKAKAGWWSKSRFVVATAGQLPLSTASVDVIYSALMLQWCSDLGKVLTECRRVLKPGGVLLLACYGPDTLCELRQSWAEVDEYTHTLRFMDMHDLGDTLMRHGFVAPVLDTEYFNLQYTSVEALAREIKAARAHYVGSGRRPGLTGKQTWQRMCKHYQAHFMQAGLLPAKYEIIYAQAFVSNEKQTRNAAGEVFIPLSQLKHQ